MSNVATVSFKIAPELCTVLRTLAECQGLSLSAFVRRTIQEALDLERKAERVTAPLAEEREE